jgi:hypothetical protein
MTTNILILLIGIFVVASVLVLPTLWKDYKKRNQQEKSES